MRAATDDESLCAALEDETMADYFYQTGYQKAVKMVNRNEIIEVMAIYHTIVKIKAQIDQFMEGLKTLLLDQQIRRNPDAMLPLFVPQPDKKLTAGNCAMHCNYVAINYCLFLIEYIKGLFKIKFSDKASQYRSAEEAAYINFVDFPDQCEGND